MVNGSFELGNSIWRETPPGFGDCKPNPDARYLRKDDAVVLNYKDGTRFAKQEPGYIVWLGEQDGKMHAEVKWPDERPTRVPVWALHTA